MKLVLSLFLFLSISESLAEELISISSCSDGGYDPSIDIIKRECNIKQKEFYNADTNEVILCEPSQYFVESKNVSPPLTFDPYERIFTIVDNICRKNKKPGITKEPLVCLEKYPKFKCEISEPEKKLNLETVYESNTKPLIDINSAKKQCSKLGYKPKTEKFGKCVLELSQ